MKFRRPFRSKSAALNDTLRCGRCAQILPDETLTFCPSCGVPFSEVPATQSYVSIDEHRALKELRNRSLRQTGVLVVMILSFVGFIASVQKWTRNIHQNSFSAQMRSIEVYQWTNPNYPSFTAAEILRVASIAADAFENHFRMPLGPVAWKGEGIPQALANALRQAEKSDLKNWTNSNEQSLSLWEHSVFPKLSTEWLRDPHQPLPVVVVNFPIEPTPGASSQVQMAHLNEDGTVSGLGHPALTIVSSYRALTAHAKEPQLKVRSREDALRYVGEYVFAHELGHALLGLEDFVVQPPSTTLAKAKLKSPTIKNARSPAAIVPIDQTTLCLMHTDAGGGIESWAAMRLRSLGQPSPCRAYDDVLAAFELRKSAILLLQAGDKKQAKEKMAEAIAAALKSTAQPWVAKLWTQEYTQHFM